jgi:hypothetical protein
MKKVASLIVFMCLAPIITGIYYGLWKATITATEPILSKQKTIAGVINVRTQKSSGSGTVIDVTSAAQKTGLNFVLVTDLNDFQPQLNNEKYYENVLVLSGGTYSYLGSILINFAYEDTEHLVGAGRVQTVFTDILSRPAASTKAGSFVLTHPLRPSYQLNKIPQGLTGIEIFNLKNIFQRTWSDSKFSIFWSILIYPFNPTLSFLRLFPGSIDDELNYWDRINLNSEHLIFGFAGLGADARLKITSAQYIEFPSYETLFSTVRNRIWPISELTGNAPKDKTKIDDALKSGRFYMSVDLLSSGDGFINTIYNKGSNKTPYYTGSIIPFSSDLHMFVEHPIIPGLESEIVVYKDGEVYMTSNLNSAHFQLNSPGLYRSEVRIKVMYPIPEGNKWVKWIVSNPFRIKN